MEIRKGENSSRSFPRSGILYALIFVLGLYLNASAQTVSEQPRCKLALPKRLQTTDIIRKAGEVSGILDDLAASRARFLKTGDLVELFPALYYHSTFAEFLSLGKYEPREAEAVLELMIIFYDSYKSNRLRFERSGANSVEKHWKNYYRGASALNRSGKPGSSAVIFCLLDGVDAHLTDLARSLRYFFSRMPLSAAEFHDVYYAMDALFTDVATATNDDILAALKTTNAFLSMDRAFGLGAEYVVHARHRAWEEATGTGKLRASKPQPILTHPDSSTSHFTVGAAQPCVKAK